MSFSSTSASKLIATILSTKSKEYDNVDREAYFFLYTRPLEDVVLAYADHVEMQHWALVIMFSDESVRTLEGVRSDGKLVPHILKARPLDSKDQQYWELIPMKTSPYKLLEVSRNNILNDTIYNAITNNCQNWVKAVAEAISPNLAAALNKFKTNGEVNIIKRAGQCSFALSRSSSAAVTSTLKELCERRWSGATNIEKHRLQ